MVGNSKEAAESRKKASMLPDKVLKEEEADVLPGPEAP